MKAIWKFGLSENCTVEMPQGARILTVREQGNDVALWAEVDPKAPRERRQFRLYGTGFELPSNKLLNYLGTAMIMGGSLVLHAYEVLPGDPTLTHIA